MTTLQRPVPTRERDDGDARFAYGLAPDLGAARVRAESIVAQMSREEKLSLVVSRFPMLAPDAAEQGMIHCSGITPGVPRLGIPTLMITDASLGVANILDGRPGDTATALPASLATGASFDPDIAYEGGAMIAGEARAKTFNVLLGGGINLTRDPWAGRNFEYIGEDPLLTGILGGAAVAGTQSRHVASTLKHYILNSQETGRMVVEALLNEAALRESDLLAFEIAIERGNPASIMSAYNRVNGHYASEHATLVVDLLKGEWGFPGWVMSDWGAVHSTEKAVLAGLDQESGMELDKALNGEIFFTDKLADALEAGRVPESRLDDMVARILVGMICSGVLDDPAPLEPRPIDAAANAEVAQRVAELGMVLLRNEGNVLPLAHDLRRVAVIGGHADLGVMSGGGSTQVRSHGGVPLELPLATGDSAWFCRMTYHASPPLDAIRAMVPDAQVTFTDGKDLDAARAEAASADVAIVFATQWRTEGTDLETLALPDGQDALIEAVAASNPRTVVVLQSGGAVLMPWLERVPAIVAAWYPGQRGGAAIARLLFGEVNPSGRLPLTFPASDNQAPRPVPPGLAQMRARDVAKAAGAKDARIAPFSVTYSEGANAGYRWYECRGETPLFHFGHGLSYTRFHHERLEVHAAPRPRVMVTLTNIGDRAGADLVQIYVRAADALGTATWRLAGFRRVELAAGASQLVEIELEPRTFARWDAVRDRWVVDPCPYPIALGRSAGDLILHAALDGAVVRT